MNKTIATMALLILCSAGITAYNAIELTQQGSASAEIEKPRSETHYGPAF